MKKNNKSKRSKLNKQKRIRHYKKNKNNINNKGFINDDNIQKAKDFAGENIEKAKDFANENIEKAKDAAIKSFEKAKDFTSDNIDKFQKYLDEKDVKGKIKNIADTGINTIKEHSKRKYPTRVLKFFHRYYMLTFIILFVLSMLIFRNIYLNHNMEIERRLNYSITNYSPSLENIIIAKEDYYTNMLIRQISSNKTATNHIILKSSNIENLESALKNVFDNYNRNLELSMNETIKSSNNVINFWFAFLTVIMIVFTLISIVINNNILKKSKLKMKKFNTLYKKQLKVLKKEIRNFENLKNKNEEINNFYNLGNIAFDNNEYDAAISYYDKVIELSGNFFNAYYNRAISYYHTNNYQKSSEELIKLYRNNSIIKTKTIKEIIIKNIIELANKNIETAVKFCNDENIDYKSLENDKQSLFSRIKNILG
ncbi:tetratricopeptide repeat protein [Brachyspira alvinipulli]|uniref:tetratricopeptide repeat protein n=1 Tax=Brachyspira alvinipulli TaxID=84379 RepID=UPI000487F7D5|nr:tetratricopeptide repeat protein [Brachyspira alvinipulli]